MFVAVEIIPRATDGIFAKVKGILSKPKTILEHRDFFGAPYAVIRAESGRDGPDWYAIEDLALECSRNVLLPDGLEPPSNTDLRFFFPRVFEREVLLATACELVARTRMPMYRRVLGLIDREGSYCDFLPTLLKHYTSVHVVTDQLEQYHHVSEQMMYQLGAPVLVSDRLTILRDSVLILSPGDFSSDEDFRMPCAVLQGGICTLRYRFDGFSGLQAALPPRSPVPPAGISPHRFAAALYELCGAEEIAPIAHTLLYNHKKSSLREAAFLLASAAGIPMLDV